MGRYQRLIDRLAAIPGVALERLGEVGFGRLRYPLHRVVAGAAPDTDARPGICLVAGIHGDEPAGVEAVVRLLEDLPDLGGRSLTVFPCLNPVGYDLGTRENGQGIDLNREFRSAEAPLEVALVREAVRGRRFGLFASCHEDRDANGFYLYEATRGRRLKFGPGIIATLRRTGPIEGRGVIDGRTNREGVLVPTNWGRRKTGWPMAIFLYRQGTPHCLILESPTFLPFEERVGMHLSALHRVFAEPAPR